MDFPTEKNPIADVEIITCSECGNPTIPTYKDDVQTQWYKCEKGHITNNPKKTKFCAEGREFNLPKETERKNQWFLGSRYSSDDTEKFNPNNFANYLIRQFFFKTDKKTDILYVYNSESGIWEPEGEIFIHQALVNRLRLEVKPHYQEGVEFYIKGDSYENVAETPNLIALENGVLDVEKQTLLEKSPGYFIISKIPEAYDINAKFPNILKFLIEVFGENQLIALQEALGYTLHKEPLFEKAFMLIGDGANGKSTFLNLLQAFLGPGNYSNVTLQEICYNRFASANLYQKMANISADLPKTAISTSGRFKMLTGRDTISAEFKHKNAFQFLNTAKMWFSCNEFPQTTEDTLAYVRRWKIFNCQNVFIGERADSKILEKLTTFEELSGFLNWILEGLKRLLTNGRFSVNETEQTLRENILKLSNPTKAFIEKNLEPSKDVKDFIIQDTLYSEFVNFCSIENLPSIRKSQFTQSLKQEIPDLKPTKQRILKESVAVYQFVKKKSVPSVPNVPSDLLDAARIQEFSKINNPLGTVRTENRECGECLNFHNPECSFPHGIDCTGHHCDYAKGCREYKKSEASN
jgi:P4 family phage/plasmid primase-like protien